MKDILLITPPFTQLNTPYPATAYLKGFLIKKDFNVFQADLGIEVILELFSKKTMTSIFEQAINTNTIVSENCKRIAALKEEYLKPLDQVIAFLQNKNQSFARQICSPNFLPQASRFDQIDDLDWAFGFMGIQDKAKHLATLYLEDLSDFIAECIDENFGFSRYAERLGQSANLFDDLNKYLSNNPTFVDAITLQILEQKIKFLHPKLICFSVPFPGNLYSAFRCVQFIKSSFPNIKTAMGGGFPNTELRSVSDPRIFDYFDYITLDDGELPIELIAKHCLNPDAKNTDFQKFKRTFLREKGEVIFNDLNTKTDYKQDELGTPNYTDLLLDKYISVIEIANPMHSLWSDGRWNKLTMAHGCYWRKCTFCDISLAYIKNFKVISAKLLVDRMEEISLQTGESGFHFVDEAAPPKLMKALALEIIRRRKSYTWWTNIRFEKNFTKDLCSLLKESGCIAVSGGLEVASDRLLKLINKGVSVDQVAQVARNFSDSGIMVHAYLMYGFPSQTIQETVDSLEMVRQLFEAGIVHSAFWHQFALTAHSPIGLNPSKYGIVPKYKEITFANNDLDFVDQTGIDHDRFSFGLKKSLFNFMHGIGFEISLQDWFDFSIPKTKIKSDFIESCLKDENMLISSPNVSVIWLGAKPAVSEISKSKKGQAKIIMQMSFHSKLQSFKINFEKEQGEWFLEILKHMSPHSEKQITFHEIKTEFESRFGDFEPFWYSKPINTLRENGLLIL